MGRAGKFSKLPERKVLLALDWAEDKVSLTKVMYKLGFKNKNSTNKAYIILARALRQAYREAKS